MTEQNKISIKIPTAKEVASFIDHTLLKPEATKQQVRKICEEALDHQFYAVCVNSSMVSTCREVLKSSKIKIASVIGFPLGACDSSVKTFEADRAIKLGAAEIDMVVHIGAVKAQEWSFLEKDIKDVVLASAGQIVKVILETHLLTEVEKKKVCEISMAAGAHFVKTSTGFNGGGATVTDVELMKKIVEN